MSGAGVDGDWSDFPDRRKTVLLYIGVALEILATIAFGAIAAVLRFGNAYVIWPELNELCANRNYSRARRVAPLELTPLTVYILAALGPLIYIIVLEVIRIGVNRSKRYHDLARDPENNSVVHRIAWIYVVYLLGLFLTSASADVIRLLISRPRPYFLAEYSDYCKEGEPAELGEEEREARLSFPSYRCAVLAYAGAVAAILSELSLRHVRAVYVVRAALGALAVVPAVITASHVLAARHNHAEDVVAGLILGAALAVYVVLVLLKPYFSGPSKNASRAPSPQTNLHSLQMTLPRPKVSKVPSIEAINARPLSYFQSRRLKTDDAFY